LRIALLQINPTAGDLNGNSALIARGVRAARSQGAALAEVIRKEFKLDVQQPSRGHSFLLN